MYHCECGFNCNKEETLAWHQQKECKLVNKNKSIFLRQTNISFVLLWFLLFTSCFNLYRSYQNHKYIERLAYQLQLTQICKRTESRAFLGVIKIQNALIEKKRKKGEGKTVFIFH